MNNTGTVASSVSRLCRYERHKTALQPAHWLILILIGTCEVARQLQFHYLCTLNPFIPCICTLTFVNHAREHINIPKYTEHFRTDHGNQGATNAIDTAIFTSFGTTLCSMATPMHHLAWNYNIHKISCGPMHTTAYSRDLWRRVVWLRITRDLSYHKISSILCVGLGTVGKILKQFEVTGDVGLSSESQSRERRHVCDMH